MIGRDDPADRDQADAIEARVRAGGLLEPGRPVVVLLSGGRDSVCLLDLAVRLADPVIALHLNYGLRDSADEDEAHCAALCARLGVELEVRRPREPRGNLQAWARGQRYAEAERLAGPRDALVAAGHTASDQVETVLYRLAASPGRRALLGMPERDGRLIRPLVTITRAETAAYCRVRGLAWREDPSNAEPVYARNRVRNQLLPVLRELHPAAEENVLHTLATLRDEAAVLDELVAAAAREPEVAKLAALPPALQRLTVQALADEAVRATPATGDEPGRAVLPLAGESAGVHVPLVAGEAAGVHVPSAAGESAGAIAPAVGHRTAEILALGSRGGTASLDVGGGLKAVVEYGHLRFEATAPPAEPAPTILHVPGRTAYGAGVIVAEESQDLPPADGVLDADALTDPLEVRPWRAGDRMRPLGLHGTRTLQDLFTDRKIPRTRRRTIPVVVSAGEIAWIPGVATGERFKVTTQTTRRARLTWREGA